MAVNSWISRSTIATRVPARIARKGLIPLTPYSAGWEVCDKKLSGREQWVRGEE